MPTIGVAIAVPEPYASELGRHRASFGDRLAHRVPAHITLRPPAEFNETDLPDVAKHLQEVATWHRPFALQLRGSGTFRPVSPVAFVAVTDGGPECEAVAADVRSGPLQCDLQFPFHPHVTVAHDLPDQMLDRACEQLSGYDCQFTVDSFALFAHDASNGWLPQYAFRLTG